MKKIPLLLAIGACFFACQPEMDPAFLDTPVTAAQFSLPGAPNSCSNVVPEGNYVKAVALNAANKITADVTVTATGTWTAHTDTVNGISFSGSGNFSSPGAKTIVLKGTGTPADDGHYTFSLSAGGNLCSFAIDVTTAGSTNEPPVANAGNDMTITLPISTVTLTGSGTDVDGSIASYSWTKIEGPGSPAIASAQSAQTAVNNLVQGSYKFELTVTDNAGATDKDTVAVTVQAGAVAGSFSMQQWLYAVITPVNDVMGYNGNGQITSISSNHFADRKIAYQNGRIHKIEYWYGGSSSPSLGETHEFIYDANGLVIKIMETRNSSTSTRAEYTYNADSTLATKKTYFQGSVEYDNKYIYTDGNLTGIVEFGDTTAVTYDTRTNSFKNICPQAYFLDIQTVFEQTNRSEIFYFSKNYPTKIGSLTVGVSTGSNQKPYEVRFGGALWYRYVYN